MGFASEYLSDRVLFEPFIEDAPDRQTSIIIIIPAYNEPDLIRTIDSLAACRKPDCSVEVLVHVNASEESGSRELEVSRKSIIEIESRKEDNSLPFRLFVFNTLSSLTKGMGAGIARKVAMDEAVRRFEAINKPEGIIVSLDADCEVSGDYLTNIYNDFYLEKKRNACSIYFEHPLSGSHFDAAVYLAIIRYELHLRYYYQALKYAGFPEVFHTVGSAFAVRAGIYVKVGGMNRKQAGEDFYFIQKTIPLGGYFYLNNVKVMPSPRDSDRVPFGTGPAVREQISKEDPELLSYNPDTFTSIRSLFLNVHKLYLAEEEDIEALEQILSDRVVEFLRRESWREKIKEINSNTSSLNAFVKRFFSWFNMFKIVKYLNWSHTGDRFERIHVSDAAIKLLELQGIEYETDNEVALLELFRALER